MTELTILEPSAIALADLQTATDFAVEALSPKTRKCYRSDFKHFAAYCDAHGLGKMPAAPQTVAAYISHRAGTVRPSTIGRIVAAIAYAHQLKGVETPTSSMLVRTVVRGIRRTLGTAVQKKKAATADILTAMLDTIPTSTRGLRDRAIIALGFGGALRRSEIVALNVEDIEQTPDGLRVTIRRSKTDQEGQGAVIAIPTGKMNIAGHLLRWTEVSGITEGLLFVPVRRGGAVAIGQPLAPYIVAKIVKTAANALGLDGTAFAGHSLRHGFVTSAAAQPNANVLRICEVTRHKSIAVLQGYIQNARIFDDHCGEGFL